jgi:signal transduction histidine kinase
LLARVRSLLRRGLTRPVELLVAGDLELDLRRQGEVLSRTLVAEQVWDMNFVSDTNVVDVAIRRLRRKVDGLAKEDQIQIDQKINVIKGLLVNQPNNIKGLEQEVIHEGTDNLKSRVIDDSGLIIIASPGFEKLSLDHLFLAPQFNRTRIIEVQAHDKTYLLASKKVSNFDNSFWTIQRLSQFSANLAHELRTPLHNLIGQTDVTLAYPRTSEEYQQVLSSNLEEYERLASILESLLFLARGDNEQMVLHKEVFNGRSALDALWKF